MAATSVFPSTLSVATSTTGALTGDGTSGNKLAVSVDGLTIDVNGSNQLEVIGASVGLFHQAVKTLTAAQIRTLPSSDVTLIAAPGSNLILRPVAGTIRLPWVADFASIDAASVISFPLGSAGSAFLAIKEAIGGDVTQLLAGGGPDAISAWLEPQIVIASGTPNILGSSVGAYDSDQVDKALVIRADNGGTGNFTLGVGTTMVVTVLYAILNTSTGLYV